MMGATFYSKVYKSIPTSAVHLPILAPLAIFALTDIYIDMNYFNCVIPETLMPCSQVA